MPVYGLNKWRIIKIFLDFNRCLSITLYGGWAIKEGMGMDRIYV